MAARLVDGAGMGKEYTVMGVTGGVGGGTEGAWQFVAGEVQDSVEHAARDHI